MSFTTRVANMKDGSQEFRVKSAYNPELPNRAKMLGGKWIADKQEWSFDPRDEQDVIALYESLYGASSDELIDVEIDVSNERGSEVWFAGRCVARRFDRDAQVALGTGVRLVSGGFASSGGSRRYPALNAQSGTVLLVRDVPKSLSGK